MVHLLTFFNGSFGSMIYPVRTWLLGSSVRQNPIAGHGFAANATTLIPLKKCATVKTDSVETAERIQGRTTAAGGGRKSPGGDFVTLNAQIARSEAVATPMTERFGEHSLSLTMRPTDPSPAPNSDPD
jgi:hypothetical protein